ncbi:MAG TPA: hypothetical protein PLO93_04440 [Candidatus Omnitrophota bacterium]|nr:hypothetical protein [Candidatus Omnitrophota bacterium]
MANKAVMTLTVLAGGTRLLTFLPYSRLTFVLLEKMTERAEIPLWLFAFLAAQRDIGDVKSAKDKAQSMQKT